MPGLALFPFDVLSRVAFPVAGHTRGVSPWLRSSELRILQQLVELSPERRVRAIEAERPEGFPNARAAKAEKLGTRIEDSSFLVQMGYLSLC